MLVLPYAAPGGMSMLSRVNRAGLPVLLKESEERRKGSSRVGRLMRLRPGADGGWLGGAWLGWVTAGRLCLMWKGTAPGGGLISGEEKLQAAEVTHGHKACVTHPVNRSTSKPSPIQPACPTLVAQPGLTCSPLSAKLPTGEAAAAAAGGRRAGGCLQLLRGRLHVVRRKAAAAAL